LIVNPERTVFSDWAGLSKRRFGPSFRHCNDTPERTTP